MEVSFSTGQFSGPLALLLSLIQEKKMTITDIALSEVTEQYLCYVDTLEEIDADELVDFLVIAAKLVLLKSKMLLPQFSFEQEDETSLEEQLRVYQQFVEASKVIEAKWQDKAHGVFRTEPMHIRIDRPLPERLVQSELHQTMLQLVHRLAPRKALPQVQIDRQVSMKHKIDHIRALLKKTKRIRFQDIITHTENKTEMIVGFLALLELVKQRSIHLTQSGNFEDIIVSNV
ncbi:segregation/condensation protein A [Patescibacteria group bacterium]|nr:segregation/condensation protein A [Patescibacteria group bacterium]MBU1721636.1 segregation/condensation protein A [Patescibacteria group bacterium]MBU1901702.1 segregation/condensation protein A [Patescibacteria group bacterium]